MTRAEAPTSGVADHEAHVHVYPVRVYYEDTDAGGIVYHANYLKFAERARTEMLRLHGREQHEMRAAEGIGFAVRQCLADYFRPAFLDDVLEVHTTVADVAGASIRLRQDVRRANKGSVEKGSGGKGNDEDLLATLRLRLAVMRADGRPTRLPDDIRAALEPHVMVEADTGGGYKRPDD